MPQEELRKITKPTVTIWKEKDNIVLDRNVEWLIGVDECDKRWETKDEEDMIGVDVSKGIFDRVADREDLFVVIDKLGKEYWGRPGDVAIGKDIGKDVKVEIGGFFYMIDIWVVGIDRDVGIFGIFGDVGDVITDGVDIMGNVGVFLGVEVGGTGCFINVSRGVVIGVFEVDVGEGIDVRDVGICVDISGAEIGVKDESNVVDCGVLKVEEVDGIVKFDVDVIRILEGVGSRQGINFDIDVWGTVWFLCIFLPFDLEEFERWRSVSVGERHLHLLQPHTHHLHLRLRAQAHLRLGQGPGPGRGRDLCPRILPRTGLGVETLQGKEGKHALTLSFGSPVATARRACTPPPPEQPRKSSPIRKSSPPPESVVLHIGNLSRNVNEAHLKEIFSNFGEVVNVELSMDRVVQLPKGYGYVEFKTRPDAEKALLHMNGGQVDGNVITARFTLPQRTRTSPPPRAVVVPPKRDLSMRDTTAPDAVKDGAVRHRESPPLRRKSRSPLRRSPIHRRGDSPRRRGDSPARRRPVSPPRRNSSPPFRRRNRSPIRTSPRRMRGSPVGRLRSPLSHRRRSPPRRGRTPPRRSSPVRRRTRSPPRRSVRSRSTSRSPVRRARTPPRKRGKSSSSSSESPIPRKRSPRGDRKISRSRSPR
ncbi:hypothetical protein KI387_012038, partial [Taxus chinensis]